ncbi:response regulator transcription factor [Acidocella sp.]|uniref:response regulator transcription factor n=1 Tax=Acidocella sp. TaxID=50710 RepID=UPI0017E1FD65|nr:response regulator transcription factor [Acidocella sp.]NNM57906.1 response regulator transcription factor [Acidocella sp.]
MRILLIEDDPKTAEYLSRGLGAYDHEIMVAADGHSGLIMAAEGAFDVLIIDRMLPGIDGLTLLRTLRMTKIDVPALFLTALDSINDRVMGLQVGGDDYLVKPFSLAELEARIGALSRRQTSNRQQMQMKVGDLELDRITREVRRDGTAIDLTPKEFKLLTILMLYEGQAVTRKLLLEKVWNYRFTPSTKIVESHISRLRDKIDSGYSQTLIHTCQRGYRIKAHA